jgi:hypothetical protein
VANCRAFGFHGQLTQWAQHDETKGGCQSWLGKDARKKRLGKSGPEKAARKKLSGLSSWFPAWTASWLRAAFAAAFSENRPAAFFFGMLT